MCVDCPPITRRPITRLAYCTGMRRSPRSTRTMKATTAIIIAIRMISVRALQSPVMNTLLIDVADRVRQAHHDAGEDDQRHAVADAALGDLLTQPHDEGRAGGQREDGQQDEPDARD